MASSIPKKKLFTTALFTSALIATLAIAPLTYVKSVPVSWSSIGIHASLIFFIWLINISLVFLFENSSPGKFGVSARYILSYIICIALLVPVILLMRSFIHENERSTEHFFVLILVLGFSLNSIILVIQDLMLLREKKARIELENAELKIKNIEATNQQLKQQIHPHFLFNSLNTLKTLIKKQPDKAEAYLVMLSDFLRGSISSDIPNIVKVKDEIKLCMVYLEMQKIRFGEALIYTVNIPEDIQVSRSVPVFSVQQLLENAIKHNAFTEAQPLEIGIRYETGRIITENTLQPKLFLETSTGVGLANLADRYRILSGDEIIIKTSDKSFSVSISTFGE